MIGNINCITYRGALKSCNYSCYYCPFAKNDINNKELDIDKKAFDKFCETISKCSFNNRINILIAPYGEALIHKYYSIGIAKLSKNNNVNIIGIQTNLSWDAEKWIKDMKNEIADFTKITLWCTYHPTMTSLDEFVKKVEYLSEFINLSVGVVGDPTALDEIKALRDALPIQVYLWINNMDGKRRKYTEEEIVFFEEIDPLFSLEISRYGENYSCSCLKNHRFITAKGDMFFCNRNPKVLGNMYKTKNIIDDNHCSKRRCDCYLSYSHLSNIKELQFFGGQELVRVPKRLDIKAIFLDVDGTITDKKGTINKRTKMAINYLKEKVPIYLVTERSFDSVMRKYSYLRNIISGGAFDNGAHIIDYKSGYEKFCYITEEYDFSNYNIKIYSNEGKPYKLFFRYNENKKLLEKFLDSQRFNVVNTRGRVTVVSKGVNKYNGLLELCDELSLDKEKILTVGNDYNDLDIIKKIKYSVAVKDAPDILKKMSKYVIDVCDLVYII